MMNAYKLPNSDQHSEKIDECPKSVLELTEYFRKVYETKCQIFTLFCELNSELATDWVDKTLPKVWNLANEGLAKYFPGGQVQRLNVMNAKLTLTRGAVGCLLANMLLGRTKTDDFIAFYSDFGVWIGGSCRFRNEKDPRLMYCLAIFHYFNVLFSSTDDSWKEEILFERHFESQETIDKVLATATVDPSVLTFSQTEMIGDCPGTEIECDFANKNIGYGATGTQEELMFGSSPELCVASLFIPTLSDTEVVTIQGAWKICEWTGYAGSVAGKEYTGLYDPSKRVILAIDALDFSDIPEEDRKELLKHPKKYASLMEPEAVMKRQLEDKNKLRELRKLYVGFKSVLRFGMPIATGKWGCGAFMGDPLLKGYLQVAAASAVGGDAKLKYCVGSDVELMKSLQHLVNKKDGQNVLQSVVEYLVK